MKLRNTLSLLLSLAMAVSLCALPARAAGFTDVPTGHWACAQINEAVTAGITNGYSDGSFKPSASVTYAHFMAFLARAFYAGEYNDTNASPWYQPYWDVLSTHKIVEGTQVNAALLQTGSITSKVNTSINRYDMAMMMYNIIEDKGGTMPTGAQLNAAQKAIGDYDSIDYFYRECVKTCYALGLLNGQADGTFGGSNYMNRAQGCVVISRLKDYLEDGSAEVTPSTPDNDDVGDIPASGATYDTSKYNVPADTNKDGILTEKEVQTAILALKDEYPQGSAWGEDKYYYSLAMGGAKECAAYAYMVSDAAFGNLPRREITSVEDLRVGDIGHSTKSGSHWSVVTDIDESYIYGTSGNNGGKVSWAQSSRKENAKELVAQGYLTFYTRYPA